MGSFALSRLHLTDEAGAVDANNERWQDNALANPVVSTSSNVSLAQIQNSIDALNSLKLVRMKNFCSIQAINQVAGDNAKNILAAYIQTKSDSLATTMVTTADIRMPPGNSDYISNMAMCQSPDTTGSIDDLNSTSLQQTNNANVFPWTQDQTWQVLSAAMAKDAPVINAAAKQAGADPRMVAAAMFAEQSRLYRTERGLFKKYLAALQILAAANQFSLGVMGIKPDTAKEIEKNLTDSSSVYYLGPSYQHLLDFSTQDQDQERYDRLSSEADHYYSYLYGALYIRQVEQQWASQNIPIANRPEIVGTLFNIGFQHSKPHPNPAVGGSVITIGQTQYTFGSLVYEFYYSGELQSEFPYTMANSMTQ